LAAESREPHPERRANPFSLRTHLCGGVVVYIPDWEPLAKAFRRVVDSGSVEQQARIDICHAIADRKIAVRALVADSAPDVAGRTLSGGNLSVPVRLAPDDLDWVHSRPLKPWSAGPALVEHYEALWSWAPRPIALLELSTADVIDVLCNFQTPSAPCLIQYRKHTGSELSRRLNRGGRPPKFQWDDIWFRLMRHIHEKGFPERHSELVGIIQELCRDARLEEPDESTLKPKVRRLFEIWYGGEKRS
jgi:hypothetical protein